MVQQNRECFITVGTTRFDRLCEVVLTTVFLAALKTLGYKQITFQVGNSQTKLGEYEKDGIQLVVYRFKDSIQSDIRKADFVISHAGAGSCLEALEANKPLLVVVNEDLMDNHQVELAEQLASDGHLYYCTCDTLESTLTKADFSLLVPFPKPDTSLFAKYLDGVLGFKTE